MHPCSHSLACFLINSSACTTVFTSTPLAARNQELHNEIGERTRADQRLRFLADTIPSIVWTCAPDGSITYANRHWYEYYGRPADGGPADLTRLVLHPDDADAVRELVTRSLAAGEKFEFEARHRAHDGDYCWYMTRAVPWRDAEGEVTSWFGISTSVHEMKQLMEQLQETDRRKDEFLATLAHELRNPLAPLLNALNVRRMSNPGAADDPMQGLMERQLALLVRLIDDLLDVARITRGKLALRTGATTLQSVLESAVETARPQVQHGRHDLVLDVPAEPVPLQVDGMRLSQVFANLLSNASKYSDPGSAIELSARADEDGIEVLVRDSGIGLDEEQARRIFELFVQADTAIERASGGLGIGLTLVQQLVEMHGGEVHARSEGLGNVKLEPLALSTNRRSQAAGFAASCCASTPPERWPELTFVLAVLVAPVLILFELRRGILVAAPRRTHGEPDDQHHQAERNQGFQCNDPHDR